MRFFWNVFCLVLFSSSAFSYYSFSDVKSECLAGSLVSSPYSNPALIAERKNTSFYGQFSSLFLNLPAPAESIPGYYKPAVSEKMFSFIKPGNFYSSGMSFWTLSSPIHMESQFSFSVVRNLNDFLVSRFEDRINFAATANIYTLRFNDFPSPQYSNKATSFSFDFSIFARFSDDMEYGIAMKNLGHSDIGFSRSDKIPGEFIFSIARRFERLNAIFTYKDTYISPQVGIALSADFPRARLLFSVNSSRLAAGAEFMASEKIKVTVGVLSLYAGSLSPKIGISYYWGLSKPAKSKTEKMKEFYNLACQNYKNKNYLKAIYYWKQVLKIAPNHRLSEINIEKAKKAYKRMYFSRGTKEYKLGNYKEAIKCWRKVLEIDPNHELSKKKIEKTMRKLKGGENE